jgi:hypothetical protein
MMNRRALARICVLLAGSGLGYAELFEALRELRYIPEDELVDLIREIRTRSEGMTSSSATRRMNTSVPGTNRKTDLQAFLANIEGLLKGDARLGSSAAIDMLVSEINEHGERSRPLPKPKSKETFRQWLSRVAEVIPPSDLLHFATRVRNSVVHDAPRDWPLRERDRS